VYGVYFHGPAYRVIARAWREQGCLAGRWAGDLPPGHAAADDGACAAAAPRLVELAFQVAGLAEMVDRGRMALPMAIDRVDLLGGALTEEPGIVAWVETGSGPPFDVDVRDGEGRVRIALRGYRTSPLAGELDLGPLEALRG
jgi:hypothetical protein